MPAPKKADTTNRRRPPATTPEARENQLIALAVNLAEKQLSEGTASSQVLTHFLKLAETKAELEKERLKHEVELLKAKTKNLQSSENSEKLYSEAIRAMGIYAGKDEDNET